MRFVVILLATTVAAAPLCAQKTPPRTTPSAPAPARTPRTRGADPWVGTFAGTELTVTFRRQGALYSGTASSQGGQYPLQGQAQGNLMNGQYVDGGVAYAFQAQLDGNTLQLAAGGALYVLQRRGTGGQGDGATGMTGGGGAAGGVTGTGTQDRQLAQLLMRSAWCSFSYVSGGGSSGRSSSERVVFRQDGSGARSSGGESYYSGPNGSVAGQSGGGEPFRWRIQNGLLMVTGQTGETSSIRLQVTQNSNGYPIVTANGTEYSMCN